MPLKYLFNVKYQFLAIQIQLHNTNINAINKSVVQGKR